MALTRRTPAFARLAIRTAELLQKADAPVTGEQIDAVLNHQVEQVATHLGVTARTALRYAPDNLPETTASVVLEVLAAGSPPDVAAGSRRNLRLVYPSSEVQSTA